MGLEMREMRRSWVVAAVLGAAGWMAPGVASAEEFSQQLTLGGQSLVVANLIGEITVEPATGSSFEISVTVRGRDATHEKIRIDSRDANHSELLIKYPIDDERTYLYPPLGRGSTTTMSVDDHDAKDGLGRLFAEFRGRRVTVRGTGRGFEAWADVTVKVPAGKDLDVDLGVGRIVAANVDGSIELVTRSGEIDAQGIKGDLTADTGSGEVTASDIHGDLSVDTGSGDIRISASSCDAVDLDTGSGTIQVRGLSAESIRADTGSGDIVARDVSAEMANFDTGSGDIDAAFQTLGRGPFKVSTGSGSIDLSLPPTASAEVDASSGSGGIRCDIDEATILDEDEDEMSFRLGDGRARVELETGSGSIWVGN